MNERIPDHLLEQLGEFYCSEFVALHMPWIRCITFAEYVEREMFRRKHDLIVSA